MILILKSFHEKCVDRIANSNHILITRNVKANITSFLNDFAVKNYTSVRLRYCIRSRPYVTTFTTIKSEITRQPLIYKSHFFLAIHNYFIFKYLNLSRAPQITPPISLRGRSSPTCTAHIHTLFALRTHTSAPGARAPDHRLLLYVFFVM